jgi:hypothetical protein
MFQPVYRPPYRPPQQQGQQQSYVRPAVTSVNPQQPNATGVHPNNPPNYVKLPCFNCGRMGHLARDCRLLKQNNGPRPPMNQQYNAQQQSSQQGAQKKGTRPKMARVHYAQGETILEGEPVILGMYLIVIHCS